ncbi:MAG: tRNA-dihydrouridine synthase [Parcubacteria group bacterium]
MAGITDSAFRQICKEYGADVVYSEMASVSALFFKPKKTLELVRFNKKERPYVVQLFGKNPEHFAKAAKIITNQLKENPPASLREQARLRSVAGGPDGIDINFGCPAKKVFGNGSGCALMPQKELARQIILAVCENTNLPVSLKIRAGIKGHTAIDFIKSVKDLPFSAVMVHGRTYEGSFAGPVDFKIVEKVKKLIPEKIVLANGGINTPEDAVKILKKYPLLDGLGIARGAWGRPFIFNEIKSTWTSNVQVKYDFKIIKRIMLRHAQLIRKDKKELGMFEIRKHLAWYVKGFPGASNLRRQLVRAQSVKEIKEILETT